MKIGSFVSVYKRSSRMKWPLMFSSGSVELYVLKTLRVTVAFCGNARVDVHVRVHAFTAIK